MPPQTLKEAKVFPLNTKPVEGMISLLKDDKWEPQMAESILNQYPGLIAQYGTGGNLLQMEDEHEY